MGADNSPTLVETPPLGPLPDALISDTSFLSMVGQEMSKNHFVTSVR